MNEKKDQPPRDKGKLSQNAHYVLAHCNFNLDDIFNASFSSWHDNWVLDTCATCHMTFRRDFFEKFSDHINEVVYFSDKYQTKPSRI